MGPPIYIGGNREPPLIVSGDLHASMGPPIYIGGNTVRFQWFDREGSASMGPPIYIGGNIGILVIAAGILM